MQILAPVVRVLLRNGVACADFEQLHLMSHAYVPGNGPIDLIYILGTDNHELMQTIVHNMGLISTANIFRESSQVTNWIKRSYRLVRNMQTGAPRRC